MTDATHERGLRIAEDTICCPECECETPVHEWISVAAGAAYIHTVCKTIYTEITDG